MRYSIIKEEIEKVSVIVKCAVVRTPYGAYSTIDYIVSCAYSISLHKQLLIYGNMQLLNKKILSIRNATIDLYA